MTISDRHEALDLVIPAAKPGPIQMTLFQPSATVRNERPG
jgi:hypothetical protein